MFHLFRLYDGLPEPRRLLTGLAILIGILVAGEVTKFIGYEGVGWCITIIPIFTLLGLRMLYLRRA